MFHSPSHLARRFLVLTKSNMPPMVSKCSIICRGIWFRNPNVLCLILLRYLMLTASSMRLLVPSRTPSKVSYCAMSSLCSASACALVPAAAFAASPAG